MSSQEIQGREPLAEYPWHYDVDRLLDSHIGKNQDFRSFLFDCVMSLSYIDATAGLEKSVEYCNKCSSIFNAHIGFINLCSSCYEGGVWRYQKAAKPQSGALGKLSSEVILKFVKHISPTFKKILAIGGSDYADAYIEHSSGIKILAEVKSAPLLTYPLLLEIHGVDGFQQHKKVTLTTSQLKACDSAMNMHGGTLIPLGKVGSENWPFKQFADFAENKDNFIALKKSLDQWNLAKQAYIDKDKSNKMYYLTNACGSPPIEAKKLHGWPQGEVISDGKTSAGMDRTDDIKKGIYQTLKIGITHKNERNFKTAIISNLPAYRHGEDYVDPITPLLWGLEKDIQVFGDVAGIARDNLRYAFDYIITLESPLLRELKI
ncbi:MAG: hypothetical protein HOO93_14895 [Methyloglobulus sp.]|nr:hypothetical protein [Methyloglobulus sp.]